MESIMRLLDGEMQLDGKAFFNCHRNDLTLIPVLLKFDTFYLENTINRFGDIYNEEAVNQFNKEIINSELDGLGSLILYFQVCPKGGDIITIENFLNQYRSNQTENEWEKLFNEGPFNIFLEKELVVTKTDMVHSYNPIIKRPYVILYYRFG